jgi:hypothetical protein
MGPFNVDINSLFTSHISIQLKRTKHSKPIFHYSPVTQVCLR